MLAPAYHSAIQTIAVLHFHGALGRINISVTKNRNMYPGIFLYPGNRPPVGIPFIHLHTGSPVNGYGFNTHILQSFCYFYNFYGIMIPAQPGF